MHKSIHRIVKDHENYLAAGGNQAIKVVQDANMWSLVDREMHLIEEAAYKRGYDDAMKERTTPPSAPTAPVPPRDPDASPDRTSLDRPTGASST